MVLALVCLLPYLVGMSGAFYLGGAIVLAVGAVIGEWVGGARGLGALMIQAKRVLRAEQADKPDIDAITQALNEYEATVKATEEASGKDGDVKLGSMFIGSAKSFLTTAKQLMRRVRDKVPYSSGEKMMLSNPGAGWMVEEHLAPIGVFEADPAAVAEAARNLACVGATPLAITDNLNFGNPEKPEAMGQFVMAVQGIGAACEALGFPIVSGNVSLYNETQGQGILPTPTIGGVGLIADRARCARTDTLADGDALLLIGGDGTHLGQSAYGRIVHGRADGPPPL